MTESYIHIGNLIKEQLHLQGRSVAWLARQLGTDRANFYRVLGCPSINSELLLRISIILHYDFFAPYQKKLSNACQI